MKNKVAVILSASLIVGVFSYIEFTKIDGILGEILNRMFVTDTKYAIGYTDKGFKEIQIGMSEKDVLGILGEPLIRWSPYRNTKFKNKIHYIGFQYSESPSSSNYRLRQVNLKNNIVVEKHSEFYLD